MFLEHVPAVWVEVKRGDRPSAGDDDSVIANRLGTCVSVSSWGKQGWDGGHCRALLSVRTGNPKTKLPAPHPWFTRSLAQIAALLRAPYRAEVIGAVLTHLHQSILGQGAPGSIFSWACKGPAQVLGKALNREGACPRSPRPLRQPENIDDGRQTGLKSWLHHQPAQQPSSSDLTSLSPQLPHMHHREKSSINSKGLTPKSTDLCPYEHWFPVHQVVAGL